MKSFLSAVVLASVIVSCGTKSQKDQPTSNSTTLSKPIVLPSPNYSPVSATVPTNNPVNPQNTVTTTSSTQQTTAATPAGMNPAHGQPGHRCDIAVGAPLTSAAPLQPGTTTLPNNKTMTISQPVITTTGNNPPALNFNPQAQTQTKTAPGMNPPHGQPGHRCDIAVGAPLNSKPTVAAATTPTTPTIQTITTPPVIKTDQAPTPDSSKH